MHCIQAGDDKTINPFTEIRFVVQLRAPTRFPGGGDGDALPVLAYPAGTHPHTHSRGK